MYSTTDGHTREICERLQTVIEQQGHEPTLRSIDDVREIDLEPFDKIVLGASIRYGKHSKKVYEFVRKNEQLLTRTPLSLIHI